MVNSLNILNSIRSVASQDYIERIPEATRENIKTVGNTILSYTPFTNTFFSNLINRIGKVVVNKLTPLSDIYGVFGEEKLDYGDTIQEIFIDLVKAQPYDSTFSKPTSMLETSKGVIHCEYTSVDRKLFYKTTISTAQLKEAFTSVQYLDEFVCGLIESMVNSFDYDKYVMLTETFAKHCQYVIDHDDKIAPLIIPSDVAVYNKTTGAVEWTTTGAKDILKYIKVASKKLKFYHSLPYFDKNGTEDKLEKVRTPIDKQVIALELSASTTLDVDALAVIFNLQKAELNVRNIEIEDNALGTYKSATGTDKTEYHILGFICDKGAVKRGKSFERKDSFFNPEGLYLNMWNHYWGYQAVSKMRDFVPILLTTKTNQ